jgi:serine protease
VNPQHDNYVYVRVRNRGGYPANNAQVTVYWAPPSTLLMPGDWKLIGSTVIPTVPSGNILTVSDPIVWRQSEIPGPGHYCFVALVGTLEDPAPDPAAISTWDSFISYIRDNNNATWRNFNVVAYQPTTLPLRFWEPPAGDFPRAYMELPFVVAGASDRGLEMKIEVCPKFPQNSCLWLEAAAPLAQQLGSASRGHWISRDLELTLVRLNPHGRNVLNPIFMPPGARKRLSLRVYIPWDREIEGSYECYVRQLHQEKEVGRITWRLMPPPRKTVRPRKAKQR